MCPPAPARGGEAVVGMSAALTTLVAGGLFVALAVGAVGVLEALEWVGRRWSG